MQTLANVPCYIDATVRQRLQQFAYAMETYKCLRTFVIPAIDTAWSKARAVDIYNVSTVYNILAADALAFVNSNDFVPDADATGPDYILKMMSNFQDVIGWIFSENVQRVYVGYKIGEHKSFAHFMNLVAPLAKEFAHSENGISFHSLIDSKFFAKLYTFVFALACNVMYIHKAQEKLAIPVLSLSERASLEVDQIVNGWCDSAANPANASHPRGIVGPVTRGFLMHGTADVPIVARDVGWSSATPAIATVNGIPFEDLVIIGHNQTMHVANASVPEYANMSDNARMSSRSNAVNNHRMAVLLSQAVQNAAGLPAGAIDGIPANLYSAGMVAGTPAAVGDAVNGGATASSPAAPIVAPASPGVPLAGVGVNDVAALYLGAPAGIGSSAGIGLAAAAGLGAVRVQDPLMATLDPEERRAINQVLESASDRRWSNASDTADAALAAAASEFKDLSQVPGFHELHGIPDSAFPADEMRVNEKLRKLYSQMRQDAENAATYIVKIIRHLNGLPVQNAVFNVRDYVNTVTDSAEAIGRPYAQINTYITNKLVELWSVVRYRGKAVFDMVTSYITNPYVRKAIDTELRLQTYANVKPVHQHYFDDAKPHAMFSQLFCEFVRTNSLVKSAINPMADPLSLQVDEENVAHINIPPSPFNPYSAAYARIDRADAARAAVLARRPAGAGYSTPARIGVRRQDAMTVESNSNVVQSPRRNAPLRFPNDDDEEEVDVASADVSLIGSPYRMAQRRQ